MRRVSERLSHNARYLKCGDFCSLPLLLLPHCDCWYFSQRSLHHRVLSCLSRFIVSRCPSVSLTQLRPAVCSSLTRPWMLMIATFIFLAQNFPWVWYPLGNWVGISNIILAIWLKYSYLFLSPMFLFPRTPKPGVFAGFFSLSKWQYSSQRNLSYLSRFISFLSSPIHKFCCSLRIYLEPIHHS